MHGGPRAAVRALGLAPGRARADPGDDVRGRGARHHPRRAAPGPRRHRPRHAHAGATPENVAAAAGRAVAPSAMVVLHYGGAPAPVAELAAAAGLPLSRVVEDAAHALWTRVGDREVGTISAATCFSFYATKNLPIGEGGMVTTDDPERRPTPAADPAARHERRRVAPLPSRRLVAVRHRGAGIKANMTDVNAAIGRAQLAQLPAVAASPRADRARYSNATLGDVPGIRRARRRRPGSPRMAPVRHPDHDRCSASAVTS